MNTVPSPENPNALFNELIENQLIGLTSALESQANDGRMPIGTIVGGLLGSFLPLTSSGVRSGLRAAIRESDDAFNNAIRAYLKETGLDDLGFRLEDQATPEERLRVKTEMEQALKRVKKIEPYHEECARFLSFIDETGQVRMDEFCNYRFDYEMQLQTQQLKAVYGEGFPDHLVVKRIPLNPQQRQILSNGIQDFCDECHTVGNRSVLTEDFLKDMRELNVYCKNHIERGTAKNYDFDALFNGLDDEFGRPPRPQNLKLNTTDGIAGRRALARDIRSVSGMYEDRFPGTPDELKALNELDAYLTQSVDSNGDIIRTTSVADHMNRMTGKKPPKVKPSTKAGRQNLPRQTRKAGSYGKVVVGGFGGAVIGGGLDYALSPNQDCTPDMISATQIDGLNIGFESKMLEDMKTYCDLSNGPAEMRKLGRQVLGNYVSEDEVLGQVLTWMEDNPDKTFSDYVKSGQAPKEMAEALTKMTTSLQRIMSQSDADTFFQEYGIDFSGKTWTKAKLAEDVASKMLDAAFYNMLKNIVNQHEAYERANETESKSGSDEGFFIVSPYGERYVEQEDITPSLLRDNHTKIV